MYVYLYIEICIGNRVKWSMEVCMCEGKKNRLYDTDPVKVQPRMCVRVFCDPVLHRWCLR